MSLESDQNAESVFSEESGGLEGINTQNGDLMRNVECKDLNLGGTDVFGEVETSGYEDWATPEDFKPWDLEKEGEEDVFGVDGETKESLSGLRDVSEERPVGVSENDKQLEVEAKALTAVLKVNSTFCNEFASVAFRASFWACTKPRRCYVAWATSANWESYT